MKRSIPILLVLAIVLCFSFSTALAQAPARGAGSNETLAPRIAGNEAPARPLPLPRWTLPLGPSVPESRVISCDVASRTVTEEDLAVAAGAPAAFSPGFAGLAPCGFDCGCAAEPPYPALTDPSGPSHANFGSLKQVKHPENYPFRVNCKIYITFPNGLRYQGSAVLIDDNFVLTAGHCVYSHSDGGWATALEVIPGYDNGWRPYGTAWATVLYSWTGWTQNGDFDHDMGLVKLDSSIGYQTGWYGYGYTTNNNYYFNATFYNPGFPAESPYNGQYMYFWYGDFDMVLTYILYFNSLAYGGQSGSGVASFYHGDPYVSAVVSHTLIWMTGDTRMTPTKFDQIKNWISSGDD